MSYVEWIRSLVGRRKIFLVFGAVMLRDAAGRILLQKRTDFGFWGLPGGVLELAESIQECARRELLEETGLRAGSLRLSGVYTHPRYDVTYPNGDEVQQCSVCFAGAAAGGELRPDGHETSELSFFEPASVSSLSVPLWYRDMIADALRDGKPAFSPPYAAVHTSDQFGDILPYVGASRLIAVSAAAVVVRADGRLLMVQQRDDSRWGFAAGYTRLGENIARTAVRETLERTGLKVIPERIIGVYSSPRFHESAAAGLQVKPVGTIFRCRPLEDEYQPDLTTAPGIAWMTRRQCLDLAAVRNRPLLELVLRHLDAGYFVD